jgi:Domain of unknown function (DUF4461)/Domain of unknown function (DUF4460)
MFAKYPQERESNEKSIAHINSLVDALKDGSLAQDGYPLNFYVKKNDEELRMDPTEEAHTAMRRGAVAHVEYSGSFSRDLKRISMHIRTHSRGLQSVYARRNLYESMKELLSAVGIGGDFLWGDIFRGGDVDVDDNESWAEHSGAGSNSGSGPMHSMNAYNARPLSIFMQDFKEVAHTDANTRRDLEAQNHFLSLTLRVNRINVIIENEASMTAFQLHQVLTQVKAAFRVKDDSMPSHRPHAAAGQISINTVAVISESARQSHVDDRGRLVLSMQEDAEQWNHFLHERDNVQVEKEFKKHASKITAANESQVAHELGLHHLYCDPQLFHTPAYLETLERLLDNRPMFVELMERCPDYQNVTIRMHGPEIKPPFSVDSEMGYLSVPLTVTPKQLCMFIEQRASQACFLAQQYAKNEAEVDQWMQRTRRRLRLKSLTKHHGSVTMPQMLSCLKRLASAEDSLMELLHGMDIEIADSYKYDNQGKCSIPWDWH